MKQKRRNKTRKLISRIWILICLIIGIFIFSEKVYKLENSYNVKKQVNLMAEQVQNDPSNVLVLNTNVNLNAANGKGGVDLDWSTYDATGKVFKAYQKKENSEEWETISTFDYYSNGIEPIKVLNIYPNSSEVPTVTFKYLDGTSKSLPKSAALKVWMEGGTMNGTSFEAYGKNPITGEQIIKVIPISNTEFSKNPNIVWNYDVLMIGTWDGNGHQSLNDNAIKIIEEYIKAGYGILSGHDTMRESVSNGILNKLRKYFNIDINELSSSNNWKYSSTTITVNKTGILTNFPYELPLGTKLTIPLTHTMSNAAVGNVWMTFINGSGTTENYKGKGNPYYYLTTWNNTAMIQTGHSNCESTDDERKVLANTLFYLKQLTKMTNLIDNSSQDLKAPDAPKIFAELVSNDNNIKIDYSAKDNGSKYSFYVEAYDSSNSNTKLATSNESTEIVVTGTRGCYYIVDEDSSNKDFDINTAKYTEDTSIILDVINNGKYIHMKAVDIAGNVGAPSVIKIDVEEYTITIENDRNGHTYNSYQIFQGDYSEKEDEEGNKIPTLSNIEWGEELQKEIEEGKTHGDKIIVLLKENEKDKLEKEKIYTKCETAEDIAKVLQGKEIDGEIIRNFTDIVGKYILENNIPITKGTCELIEEKDSNGNVISSNYKIKHLEPGYYIVIDAEANPKDDAYSRYLIDVVQDVTMYPKSSIPTIRKKVIGNNIKILVEESYVEDEKRNTATYKEESEIYNVEDYDIEFELKSYIPNPDGYSTYKFEIVDILAKGFDYDRNSIKIMLGSTEYPKTSVNESGETVNNYTVRDVVITESNYETYKNYFEEEEKEYLEGYAESQYGKTLILIEINDLVEQLKAGVVQKAQDVIVTYNAKLNGNGEVGITPNTNEAYLKYSNNPYNNEQITQTTTQITYTYTIDLNLSKIAELKNEDSEKVYLSGAEFEIYSEPNKVEERTAIATITTDELGKCLYSSLGSGTYYLKEIKAPDGYNKLREEIELEVNAICDELGTITWTVEEKNNNNLIYAQMVEKKGTTIPEIKLQVENKSGFQLPVTGGTGIRIFVLLGLSIMLLAVISLKSNKK